MAEYIVGYVPGQISLSNYVGGNPATTYQWAPGIYTKIQAEQMNHAMVANHNHMPNPYLPNSGTSQHVDSVFGELDRKAWLKGILIELDWGKIESAANTWNWDFIDFVFNTIRTLPKATGQDKKVLLLINMRAFGLNDLSEFLPADLLTQPGANGGYYKNTTSFPPANTNPPVNAKKFDHAWCYEASDPNAGGAVAPRGYNFNLYKFTAAAGTNTLKTRFYAFLDAIAARYGDDDVFAGIVTTEAATGSPFVAFESGNSRNANYEGRKNMAIQIRATFPNRIVAECVNFDKPYYTEMTAAGAADGLIANHLTFTTANLHNGTNMNLGNINPVLAGKIPIMMQIQGLDMRTISGNRPQYYNWPTNPTQILSGNGVNYDDPPTAQHLMDKLTYYNANYAIFQRNYGAGFNVNEQTWPKWKTYMDGNVASPNGGLLRNDPYGGMNPTEPQIVV